MAKVLIAGGGLQAISTARSLAEAGHEVGLWAPGEDYAHKSRAVAVHGYGSVRDSVARLMSFISEHRFETVIPMSDAYADLLSRNKQLIADECGCLAGVPDYPQLEPAADKLKLMALCAEHGLPHPRTIEGSDVKEGRPTGLTFPVVVKPNHSVGARGITKVSDPERLKETLDRVTKEFGECHVQEYVEGKGPYYNVMLYRDASGRKVAHAILEIIRYYPLQAGSSSMCRTIDEPVLVDICMKTLDALGYVGFADFDVLRTREGEYRIIEINPRVPASLRGAAVSGVNFPAIIVADTLGLSMPETRYTPGKTLRYLGLDIMWFLSSPDRFSTRPGWFRFWGKDIYYQEGGLKDLKPMIATFLDNFKKLEFKGGRLRKKSH